MNLIYESYEFGTIWNNVFLIFNQLKSFKNGPQHTFIMVTSFLWLLIFSLEFLQI